MQRGKVLPQAGLLVALLAGVPAQAQVEEIVVTTRKREERLQEIPVAVTAIGEETLQSAGVRGIQDLAKLSSSLNINESFSQNDQRITIRGLTNTRGRSNVALLIDGVDVTSETTGTNAGSPLLVNQRLLTDIERVEIVRGPQSALFGRAAFAGAIAYVTKEPGEVLEGRVATELADGGGREVSAAVSVPVTDALGLRLNGVAWEEDGFYANVASGDDVGGGSGSAFAGTLVYRPFDGLKVKARVTWSDDQYDIRPVALLLDTETLPVPESARTDPDGAGPLGPVTSRTSVEALRDVGDASGLVVRASEDVLTGGAYPGTDLEVLRGTLFAEWALGAVTLQSYTGVTDAEFDQRYDLDRQAEGEPDIILGHNDVDTRDDTEQFSQELRLASDWDFPVQLTVGALYWHEERSSTARNLIVVCSTVDGPNSCSADGYVGWQQIYRDIQALDASTRIGTSAETDHWSAYALVEWQATDTVRLALEDRYVEETFDAVIPVGSTCANFYPDAGPDLTAPLQSDPNLPGFNFGCRTVPPLSGEETTRYHTPRVTVDWKLTPDWLLYASVAKGEKPGGISLLAVAAPIPQPLESFYFEPEIMWAYELGTKTSWDTPSGPLTVNAAAFHQDYTDKQVTITRILNGFPVAFAENASAAHVTGAEFEVTWLTPLEGLTASLAYTWLDTEYDDYTTLTRSASAIAIYGSCDVVRADELGQSNCVIDRSGNELEYAPEHALAAQLSWRAPVGDRGLGALAELDARYQDAVYTGDNNFTRIDAWWRLDFRAGLEGEHWRLIAFLDNVLDDDTILNSGSAPDFAAGAVDQGPPVSALSNATATLPDPRVFGVRLSYDF